MRVPGPGEGAETARDAGDSLYRTIVDVVLTGFAVILPLVVTVYVLKAALDLVVGALDPFIRLLEWAGVTTYLQTNSDFIILLLDLGIYSSVTAFLSEIVALIVLVVGIVVLGALARNRWGKEVIDAFDAVVTAIPGVGTVYRSFRRMGDVMLQGDVENFRDVKLVEFPDDGIYVIGFETNAAPESVGEATGDEGMRTMFLPLAPNPVMGGFLTYVPDDRILDVEMTVEEGVRALITSGIAVEEGEGDVTFSDTDRNLLQQLQEADYVEPFTDDDEDATGRDSGDRGR